jgi:hypothetical protein
MANPHTMIVYNNGDNALTIAGQTVPANGSFTYATSVCAQVCTDPIFRTAFLMGTVTVDIDGQTLSSSVSNAEDVIDQIASGNITV